MVPLMMPSASHDTDASGNGSHDQKSHVALPFDCHDVRNAMVPLMILLASYDVDASTDGVTTKKSCCILIADLRNAVMPLASSDTDTVTNGIT